MAALTADGVRCDWLDTSHAFHSALLDPILDEFEAYANRFDFRPPQRILVCNRTGAALGRNVKLDGAYWRRHARQPVEFAKSVRTLADLNCKVLLEIGPQPVLTATALRAWPDPATTPRAIASLRRNTADHRQITEALADAYIAGHLPDFTEFGQAHARKLDLPTYPFERRQYWYLDNRERPNPQQHLGGPRTEAVRLLEDGHLEELATLLDGASVDDQTMRVLTKLAAQHNQQRTSRSIADDRYEIPLAEIRCVDQRSRRRRAVRLDPHRGRLRCDPVIRRCADRAWPPAPDRRVAGVPTPTRTASQRSCVPRRKTIRRCVSCTSPPSTRIQIR